VSAIQAARAAASLKRELNVDVDLVDGHYGELSVLVDDERVLTAGPLGFLGILPSRRRIREAVEEKLSATGSLDSRDA
jgi:hypothetical protein